MSGISAQYADGLEFRIKELGEQVEKLKAELASIDGALNDPRANLTLTTSEVIWELKEQVEKLTEESVVLRASSRSKLETISSLELQVEKLTKERDDLLGYKKYWKEWLNLQNGDARQIAERAEYADALEQQLAAIAEQNEKMREALAECEQALDECRDYPVTLNLVIEALSLPDLMPSALNRIKAEAYREAADICSEKHSLSAAEEAIRNRKAELEKNNG